MTQCKDMWGNQGGINGEVIVGIFGANDKVTKVTGLGMNGGHISRGNFTRCVRISRGNFTR